MGVQPACTKCTVFEVGTLSFFPSANASQVTRVPPYVRYPFPSQESRHVLERDDLGPPVVPGGQEIDLGSRNLRPRRNHVPRGAPSRRSGWVIVTGRRMSEPPCARQGFPHGKPESGFSTRRHMLGPCAKRRCYPTGR
jgi:hypothetical protein